MRSSLQALLGVTLLVLLASPTSALYFNVVEGTRKCFIEEVPEDVLVLGKYSSPDHGKLNINPQGQPERENFSALRVSVTDPRSEQLLTHDMLPEGRFGFTSIVGGEHIICIATNTSTWYGQARSFVRGHTLRHAEASSIEGLTVLCSRGRR